MNRTLAVFLGTLAAAAAAAIAFPGAALRPGALLPGHADLREDCLACHAPLQGARRERCVRCHEPASIGTARAGGGTAPSPRAEVSALHLRLGPAECAACHAEHSGRLDGGRAARFAHEVLPGDLRANCAGCHASKRPTDAIHGGSEQECSVCHGTASWKPSTFRHDGKFRFDGNHPPRCADCHAPADGFRAYSCTGCHEHSPARMAAKHREEGIEDIADCARCHRTGDEDGAKGKGRRKRGKGEGRERR